MADIPKLSFEDRAKGYEADMKPIIEKWKVMPWAGLQSNLESIVAVPMLKDLDEDAGKA